MKRAKERIDSDIFEVPHIKLRTSLKQFYQSPSNPPDGFTILLGRHYWVKPGFYSFTCCCSHLVLALVFSAHVIGDLVLEQQEVLSSLSRFAHLKVTRSVLHNCKVAFFPLMSGQIYMQMTTSQMNAIPYT